LFSNIRELKEPIISRDRKVSMCLAAVALAAGGPILEAVATPLPDIDGAV